MGERGCGREQAMAGRQVVVTLEAAGVPAVTAQGVLDEFSAVDRIRRAAVIVLVAVIAAAALIPIPIIHLVGIPLMLLIGLGVAARQLTLMARLQPLRMPCPKCGATNRLGGGLGMRHPTAPQERVCASCRRGLVLRVDAPVA